MNLASVAPNVPACATSERCATLRAVCAMAAHSTMGIQAQVMNVVKAADMQGIL
jgi:hypothetical protein